MTRMLLKAVSVVSSMTLLSRILGFVRDILFARLGGAMPFMDAFFIAFKIPNFLRRLFAEGAFSQAFVPVLAEYKERRSHAEARELADRVAGALGAVVFVLSVIGVVAAPVLVFIFAPGFWADGERFGLATEMLRWTFPYILFMSLTALAGGILNTWGRFGAPAFTPVLLNLALIGAALYLAPHTANPGLGLAIGVFVAGVAQLAFQIPFLARIGMLPRPRHWKVSPPGTQHSALGTSRKGTPTRETHEGVTKIFRLMLPAIFGSSVAQINLLFDTLIASFLVVGSVSWLYYSDRLVEFPLGVFSIALATVILPRLSSQFAARSGDGFAATLDWAMRWTWLVTVPAAVGLFVLAGPVLATLFEYGAFESRDTTMARMSLMAYAFGLIGFSYVKVLAPGFFSRQDTKTPVRIGVIALVANMAMNVAFVVPWVMLGFPGAHAGLALATSLSAALNATLLYRGLRRDGALSHGADTVAFHVRVVAATVVMAAVVWWFAGPLDAWHAMSAGERAGRLAAAIALGGATYTGALVVLGLRPQALKVRIIAGSA